MYAFYYRGRKRISEPGGTYRCMYVYVYVYVYVHVYVYVYMYIYTYVCMYVYTYIYIYIYVSLCVYMILMYGFYYNFNNLRFNNSQRNDQLFVWSLQVTCVERY